MHLRAVTNAPQPWSRQIEESAEEYALFWLWCGKGGPRLEGPASDLASKLDWTARYRALQSRLDEPNSPIEYLDSTKRTIDRILWREVQKLERESAKSTVRVLQVKDMKVLLELKYAIEQASMGLQLTGIDPRSLECLSDADLDEIERCQRKLELTIRGAA